MSPRRRAAAAGCVLIAVYVAVVALGPAPPGHQPRPLFEGFTKPPPYHWVKPPKPFLADNLEPVPKNVPIEFAGTALPAATAQTDDGQCVVSLAEGAVPFRPGDAGITTRLEPEDPGVLPHVPNGLRPTGNIYRVTLRYRPSGIPIAGVSVPGNVFLATPEPAKTILFSGDGRSWRRLPSQRPLGRLVIGAAFVAPGFYLATTAADAPVLKRVVGNSSVNGLLSLGAGFLFLVALWGAMRYRVRRAHRAAGARSVRKPPPGPDGASLN